MLEQPRSGWPRGGRLHQPGAWRCSQCRVSASPSTAAKDSPASERVHKSGAKGMWLEKMLPPWLGEDKMLKGFLCWGTLGPVRSWGWWKHLLALHHECDKEQTGVLLSAACTWAKQLNPDTHFCWHNHPMVNETRSQRGAARAGAARAGASRAAARGRSGRGPRRFCAHQRPARHEAGSVWGCGSGTGCKPLGRAGSSVGRAERPAMPCEGSHGWLHTRLLINTPDTHYKKKIKRSHN